MARTEVSQHLVKPPESEVKGSNVLSGKREFAIVFPPISFLDVFFSFFCFFVRLQFISFNFLTKWHTLKVRKCSFYACVSFNEPIISNDASHLEHCDGE